MKAFAKNINISGKQARYYNLSQLTPSIQSSTASRVPAHFYGGNSFTVGTYSPLLSALATDFKISSLALRGYWYDKPQRRRLTREQDAEILIEFLEKRKTNPSLVLVIRKEPLPLPSLQPSAQICFHSYI